MWNYPEQERHLHRDRLHFFYHLASILRVKTAPRVIHIYFSDRGFELPVIEDTEENTQIIGIAIFCKSFS